MRAVSYVERFYQNVRGLQKIGGGGGGGGVGGRVGGGKDEWRKKK